MCGRIPALDGWEQKSSYDEILRLGGESLHVKTQVLVLGSTDSAALPKALCRAEDVAHPGNAHIRALLKYWGISKALKHMNVMKRPPGVTQLDEVLRMGV